MSLFGWWEWLTGKKRELDASDVEDIAEPVLKRLWKWLKERDWRWPFRKSRSARSRQSQRSRAAVQARKEAPVNALQQDLRHRDGEKRLRAARELGLLGAEAQDAIPALIAALADVRPEVRGAARDALSQIDPKWPASARAEESVPALADALGNRTFEVVQAASGVLQQLGRVAVPALLELLDDDCKDLRQVTAAQALGRIGVGDPAVIDALARVLKSEKTHVRLAASDALGGLGAAAERAVPALVPALGDWNPSVRRATVRCLGQVGLSAAPAVPLLCRLLADEDDGVRQAAIESLASIGLVAIPLLLDVLKRRDLRELEEWMRLQVETGEWLSRSASSLSSGWDPGRAIPNLKWHIRQKLDELETRTRQLHQNVTATLGRIGPGAAPAVSMLTQALDDEDAGLRLAAIKALGRIGPAALPAVPGLVRKLTDAKEGHRKAAIEALPLIKQAWANTPEARRALSDLIDSLRSRSSATGQAAFDALVLMGGSAVPALAEALSNSDRVIRETAAEALARIGPAARDAIPALRRALEDEHGWVREAAGATLKQLEGASELKA